MDNSFTEANKLPEPERTKLIAKSIKPTKIYPVYNPGAEFGVTYQNENLVIPSGESKWPEEFAYWLLCKYNFNKSPFDKTEKESRFLEDGMVYEPPVEQPKYDYIETFPEIVPEYDDITAKELTLWLGKLEVEIPDKAKKRALYELIVARAIPEPPE